MNIGFIAHDNKKTLMQNFCVAYHHILSKHDLCATGTTGRRIEEVTNLHIKKFLTGSFAETSKPHEPNLANVVLHCDAHNIPVATNLATAELLILALDRGDLDWRMLYK